MKKKGYYTVPLGLSSFHSLGDPNMMRFRSVTLKLVLLSLSAVALLSYSAAFIETALAQPPINLASSASQVTNDQEVRSTPI